MPAINNAVQRSRELVLEVNDLQDKDATAKTFLKLAISPGLPPVLDRVPADKRAGLQALMEKAGMSGPALNQFESWAVAVTLASGLLKDLDVSPDYGVEKQLQATFAKSKKPVSGLETTELQLGLFDKLPESAQRTFLSSMVDDSVDPAKEFNDMVSAWSKGDDTAIAASFDDEFKRAPELAQSLLYNRNANWTAWVEKRLQKPGTVFVAVGFTCSIPWRFTSVRTSTGRRFTSFTMRSPLRLSFTTETAMRLFTSLRRLSVRILTGRQASPAFCP